MPDDEYQRTLPLARVPIIYPAVFADDCAGTFTYRVNGTGADYVAEYDPTAALVGLNGILLKTKETSPTADDFVRLAKGLWLPPHRRLRLQAAFQMHQPPTSGELTFAITWADGQTRHEAGIMADQYAKTISYISGGSVGSWTHTINHDIDYCEEAEALNKIDLTLYLDEGTYGAIRCNEQTRDLSGIALHSAAAPTAYYLDFYLQLLLPGAAQLNAWIDQILISAENP